MAPQKNDLKNSPACHTSAALEQVRALIEKTIDPLSGKNLDSSTSIEGLSLQNGQLSFVLKIDGQHLEAYKQLVSQLEKQLKTLAEIGEVHIVLTAHRPAAEPSSAPKKTFEKIAFPQIKKILAVASGKGGVGKSTVAVNLALSLHQQNLKVGLMDADLYGPSIPLMLRSSGQPSLTDDKKLSPHLAYGLKCMSMGFMIDEQTPVIWRGPMIQSGFQQLLKDTDWGELDVLVIDLPPGTGDTHLTLIQRVPLDGIVIVSTPQDIALLDARRAVAMFRKLGILIVGMIENMSVFVCPHCHQQTPIFHHDGARAESLRQDIPFLGAIPLHLDIRQSSDSGQPISTQSEHPIAKTFHEISQKICKEIFINS